ncbi:MAG: hypothetical protein U0941_11850 [Planctomycetaceae bacterium]
MVEERSNVEVPMLSEMLDLIRHPGLKLEMFCASLLTFAVLAYLVRVTLISLWEARRMETQAIKVRASKGLYTGPNSAG